MNDPLSELRLAIEEEINSIYSKTVLDHAMNPRNVGRPEDPDGWASYTGPCGDTMEIGIRVEGGYIVEARFWTDGCGTSIAAGSMVTEMAVNQPLEKALETGQKEVLEALDGLPEESEHCALLASAALKLAIGDYLKKDREPWRRDYGLHRR